MAAGIEAGGLVVQRGSGVGDLGPGTWDRAQLRRVGPKTNFRLGGVEPRQLERQAIMSASSNHYATPVHPSVSPAS